MDGWQMPLKYVIRNHGTWIESLQGPLGADGFAIGEKSEKRNLLGLAETRGERGDHIIANVEKRQHILFAGMTSLNTNLTTLSSRLGFCCFFSNGGIVYWSRAEGRAIEEVVVRADESVFKWSEGAGMF